MPVEGAALDIERGAEPAHRQPVEPFGVQQLQRAVDHVSLTQHPSLLWFDNDLRSFLASTPFTVNGVNVGLIQFPCVILDQ
ncbi:hypothetical protein GCM10029963_02090 [Micromonospora andamanensis]